MSKCHIVGNHMSWLICLLGCYLFYCFLLTGPAYFIFINMLCTREYIHEAQVNLKDKMALRYEDAKTALS